MNRHYSDDNIYSLAELFKTFGDSTRIKILMSLLEGEQSVNEITSKLSVSQSAISHQLKNLTNQKLVKKRRQGQTIFYSLDDQHVYHILEQGIEHVNEKNKG